jgi:hypothetical protein
MQNDADVHETELSETELEGSVPATLTGVDHDVPFQEAA